MTIDHCTTDYETVDQTYGDVVHEEHRNGVHALTLRHPGTNEHLASVVPTSHAERAIGSPKYRVLVPGHQSRRHTCHSLEAAKYLALGEAIEVVARRERAAG